MSLLKRIGQSRSAGRAISWAIGNYIRLVWLTNRWTVEGQVYADQALASGKPYIGAFWHGRLLMMPYGWPRGMPLAMLSSPHRDGRIIAEAVHRFGVITIWGSSSRRGSEALRAMLRALRDGICIAITPDEPTRPPLTVSSGIVHLARLSGAPMAPITYATSRRVIFESWDRFHMPLPFGRGVFIIGEPILVPSEADPSQIEAARASLEARLRAITIEADRRVGHAVAPLGTPDSEPIHHKRSGDAAGQA